MPPRLVDRAGPARAVRTLGGALRCAPSYLIVGAEKAGTTSLYDYLTSLPDVLPARRKEVHYFDLNYHRGLRWYRNQFPARPLVGERRRRVITGEASPYYFFDPVVPLRVRDHFPNIKLIVLLRNPVTRAHSAWAHRVRKGVETLSFADAVAHERLVLLPAQAQRLADPHRVSPDHREYSYVARGLYLEQLLRWEGCFPRTQLHVMVSEQLFSDPVTHLPPLLQFLGLPEAPAGALPASNIGSYADIDPQTRSQLAATYRQPNEALARHLGMELPWG